VCAGDGIEAAEVLDRLDALVDHSLVVAEAAHEAPRYRLLETVREYALEQLDAGSDEGALRARLATYFLALAEAAEPHLEQPDQGRWLERLEEELGNLRATMHWATDADAETALRLGSALRIFFWMRGHTVEGRDWLAAILRTGAAMVEPALRARARGRRVPGARSGRPCRRPRVRGGGAHPAASDG
jgi:predicted ATPase